MNKKILVIDDDSAILKSFTLALEDTEYQVETAESGKKGIEMMQKTKKDLVFLDIKMPGMNGIQTLRELRKIDKNVPVYFVTAFHEEFFDQIKKAADEGCSFEVLRKPVSSEQIVMLSKNILESTIGEVK